MNRDPVASSNIQSVGYDGPSQTLEVEFTNGSVYQYYNVGSALYEQFMRGAIERAIPELLHSERLSVFSSRRLTLFILYRRYACPSAARGLH